MALVLGLGLGLLAPWLLRRRQPSRRHLPLDAQMLQWLRQAPVGVLVLDRQQTIRLVNRKVCALLHLQGEEAKREQRPLLEAIRCHQLEEVSRRARTTGQQQRIKWIFTSTSCNPHHLEPVTTEQLEAIALPGRQGWVGVFLLNRHSLLAQREQQERWVSDAAHELKTPLTALRLVSESLVESCNPSQVKLMERLEKEIVRLQSLVEDLLELSRLENTPLQRHATSVMVVDHVKAAWQFLLPLAEPRHVGLSITSTSPAVAIPADASRLQRALLNLLDNALRYSPDHSAIQVKIVADRNWLKLDVEDQGSGFSETDLQHAFERFYRGDASRARASSLSGSGLGLAIVQQIATTHGGKVRALNRPEGGASVRLTLPMHPAVPQETRLVAGR
ncbi:PAS domain-containing sensor histidine kinase [Candidatus Synechococcus spongiarum]|uniref:PAS domain-containing sensor histidine kinase n=1 Tax=Candidatus Synechococcus spongiarum TaxID=431041 RepID=UPI0004B01B14|nr:PAS domain-containing sensor histidine kinase [Candidatus Synechococcus spongiarum]